MNNSPEKQQALRHRSEEKLRTLEDLQPEGDLGSLDLFAIIDAEALQSMMEDFHRLTHFGSAIVDLFGKVLVAVGWQDICTKFHRCHPDTLKNCLESDLILSNGVPAGTFKTYRCKNNLWDMVTPLEVDGRHLGNIYFGQFFHEDETPDLDLFRGQARRYGFDELEYLAALDQRSADLTRQLLAFARKQTVAPKVLDLNETVAGMLTMLRRLIGEDISLAWLPGAGLWPVKVDPSQIDQILANLCVKARDASAGVGKLTIETENAAFDEAYCAAPAEVTPGDYVLLALSDDGCGMDQETLANIFEPFFTTKGVGEGSGLGLATVYGVVKQNQGFIQVYSEPGQGTTFKIYLPRHLGQAEQPRPEGPAEPARGHETILLVEDEPAILDLGRMMLNTWGTPC